ncbi:hypothetical protein ALI22I_42880 [Saccharothrix sp. ALI-22-I]|nr:hypothetical protein ALI22I_42880 [Saccharothrix sp. ALI-22-I]
MAYTMRFMPELGVLPGGAPLAAARVELVFADENGEHRVECDWSTKMELFTSAPTATPRVD